MKRIIKNSVTSSKSTDAQREYEYRKNIYLKRKHEFETLGEDDNNDVLSREEKMRIAKAEMDKVNPKSVKSAKDATFKNDKRLSTTSERYKGYLIVLDRGGDGYNVYDNHRELEDAGYPSREAAKNFIDELVSEAEDEIESSVDIDEETASREAYAEFYPDEYDADDYDEIYSANYGGRYYVDDKYIDSSTDITAASKLWMGKYKSAKDNKMHKVYFEFDTSDFEEAEQEFEDIIPEPYSYARLLGTAPHEALLQKDGFEKIQSSSTVVTAASSGKLDKYMNVTKDRKKYAVHYTEVNTEQDAWTIYSDFRAQVSKISPYDDADYAWADIRNGHIDVIRNGKVVKRSYYFNADDMDVENTEWCDIIIDEAIDLTVSYTHLRAHET